MSKSSNKLSLVREASPATKIVLRYEYKRETKGTWVYELPLAEGQRSHGSNQFYLLKTEYPQRPVQFITVTATFGG